jgi:hypothetical protein
VESGKLKIESGGKWKGESEKLKGDKVTVAMACPSETTGASETAERGIAGKPVKAGRAKKLKRSKKKGKREIKANKKVHGLKAQCTSVPTKCKGANHSPTG